MAARRPVAIVTGGASGIGDALVKHLQAKNWRVVIADVQEPSDDRTPDTSFIKTNVSSWEDQAELFQRAFEWGPGLDLCVLNAGILDRDNIFRSLSSADDAPKPPAKPDMSTFAVNLTGVYYGIKFAAHYMSRTTPQSGKVKAGGKVIVTASGTGLYPLAALPQYTATKTGIVGLVRALGRNNAAQEANVRINAVCPAIVDTPSLPRALAEKLPQNQFTPMSTIMRCFDVLGDLDGVEDNDWVEKGYAGETLEGNGDALIWHQPLQRDTGTQDRNRVGGLVREQASLIVAEAFEKGMLLKNGRTV